MNRVNFNFFSIILVTVAILGCGNHNDSPQGTAVVSIDVSPPSTTLPLNGAYTQQFTAVARDANFNTIQGITFTWSSSDPKTACVDQNGLAYAKNINPSPIQIMAQTGTVSGAASLIVQSTGSTPPPPPNCK